MSVAPSGSLPALPLPAEVTSFVGRRAERQVIRAQLTESRLVTLTGFGGVGKTRLALRVASGLRRAFPDGLAFVPLAAQNDPDLLAQAISHALGMEGRSKRSATASLVEHLGDRVMLLILDNCEHLIDSVAILTDTLLRTCPSLRILATSREPLRIQGEAVHQVMPLSIPSDAESKLQQFEAVNLFLDRARATTGAFELNEHNRDAVAAIVTKLEGIPLAIELAAGRLSAMSPAELNQTLNDAWGVLSRGSRAAPDRQRTMAQCIEWSFGLCTSEERGLWGRLSVFSDGFEIDAVRSVCADIPAVDDVLHSLVDKSIVLTSDRLQHTRFRMLPPIRHRGLVQLKDEGQLTTMLLRHRDWCAGMLVSASREWMSSHQLERLQRLRREIGNIQAALETCYQLPGEAGAGLWMGAHALEFGLADGLFRQGRVWFDRLLEQAPEPTEARALALRTACWWAAMQGDLGRAVQCLEEGRKIAEQIGGNTILFLAQTSAYIAMFTGEFERAAEGFERVVAGFDAIGEASQAAHSLALSALTHTFRGDVASARAAHTECLARTESVGEVWYRSYSLWITGLAEWIGGDTATGDKMERESLRLKRRTGDRLGIGTSLEALAWFCTDVDPERASRLLGAAQGLWDRIETSTNALAGLHRHHEESVNRLKELLGEKKYLELHAEGRTLSQSAAIDLALEESVPAEPPSRPQASTVVDSPLTPREHEIADLVSSGLSNQDIATALVISKRTVETHVDHILTKLGFNNRHQIMVWMSERISPTP